MKNVLKVLSLIVLLVGAVAQTDTGNPELLEKALKIQGSNYDVHYLVKEAAQKLIAAKLNNQDPAVLKEFADRLESLIKLNRERLLYLSKMHAWMVPTIFLPMVVGTVGFAARTISIANILKKHKNKLYVSWKDRVLDICKCATVWNISVALTVLTVVPFFKLGAQRDAINKQMIEVAQGVNS